MVRKIITSDGDMIIAKGRIVIKNGGKKIPAAADKKSRAAVPAKGKGKGDQPTAAEQKRIEALRRTMAQGKSRGEEAKKTSLLKRLNGY